MPYSSQEGKDWIRQRIVDLSPQSVLDVGIGAGTYPLLLRDVLPQCRWIGIEVFVPYVIRFDLIDLYDELIVDDVRAISELPSADVVICGDVLEHMTVEEARQVWDRARRCARLAVFASIPIVPYPQGPEEGNEHERHVSTWSHAQAMRLPGVRGLRDCWVGEQIGVYEAAPAAPAGG